MIELATFNHAIKYLSLTAESHILILALRLAGKKLKLLRGTEGSILFRRKKKTPSVPGQLGYGVGFSALADNGQQW